MHRRVVILGIASSLAIQLGCPFVASRSASACAQEVGQYVVGAGLGLLLGSLIYRNGNTGSYSQYYGSGSSQMRQPQPTVTNGYYWDGYGMSYGPIVTPPPGYVQPQQSTVTGTIIDPYTGQPVPVTVNPTTGQTTILSTSGTTSINPTTTNVSPTPTTPVITPVTPSATPGIVGTTGSKTSFATNTAQVLRRPAGYNLVRRPGQFSPMKSMLLSHAMQAASRGSNYLTRLGGRHF